MSVTRQVRIQIRVEPSDSSDFSWEHNSFMLGDGAVNEHPHGTICYISPRNPEDDQVVGNPPRELSSDFGICADDCWHISTQVRQYSGESDTHMQRWLRCLPQWHRPTPPT